MGVSWGIIALVLSAIVVGLLVWWSFPRNGMELMEAHHHQQQHHVQESQSVRDNNANHDANHNKKVYSWPPPGFVPAPRIKCFKGEDDACKEWVALNLGTAAEIPGLTCLPDGFCGVQQE